MTVQQASIAAARPRARPTASQAADAATGLGAAARTGPAQAIASRKTAGNTGRERRGAAFMALLSGSRGPSTSKPGRGTPKLGTGSRFQAAMTFGLGARPALALASAD
ncbi:hypothetical protein GCM10011521_21960 [Arenimonas soli]|uniref:Uncharacterized protein n=1 Tax=Arenimonas soli TaxID=2269504 RepID=A0ABQ1HME7_9GAMM|nr:hypothetical protein GCM10011521_21960 [Arenimonas soli]